MIAFPRPITYEMSRKERQEVRKQNKQYEMGTQAIYNPSQTNPAGEMLAGKTAGSVTGSTPSLNARDALPGFPGNLLNMAGSYMHGENQRQKMMAANRNQKDIAGSYASQNRNFGASSLQQTDTVLRNEDLNSLNSSYQRMYAKGGVVPYEQGTDDVTTKFNQDMAYLEDEEEGEIESGNNQVPIEVERDELIFRHWGSTYKLIADFEGGATHEQGGEDFQAVEGDIIFPGYMRDLISVMLDDRGIVKYKFLEEFENEVEKLPEDSPEDVALNQANSEEIIGTGMNMESNMFEMGGVVSEADKAKAAASKISDVFASASVEGTPTSSRPKVDPSLLTPVASKPIPTTGTTPRTPLAPGATTPVTSMPVPGLTPSIVPVDYSKIPQPEELTPQYVEDDPETKKEIERIKAEREKNNAGGSGRDGGGSLNSIFGTTQKPDQFIFALGQDIDQQTQKSNNAYQSKYPHGCKSVMTKYDKGGKVSASPANPIPPVKLGSETPTEDEFVKEMEKRITERNKGIIVSDEARKRLRDMHGHIFGADRDAGHHGGWEGYKKDWQDFYGRKDKTKYDISGYSNVYDWGADYFDRYGTSSNKFWDKDGIYVGSGDTKGKENVGWKIGVNYYDSNPNIFAQPNYTNEILTKETRIPVLQRKDIERGIIQEKITPTSITTNNYDNSQRMQHQNIGAAISGHFGGGYSVSPSGHITYVPGSGPQFNIGNNARQEQNNYGSGSGNSALDSVNATNKANENAAKAEKERLDKKAIEDEKTIEDTNSKARSSLTAPPDTTEAEARKTEIEAKNKIEEETNKKKILEEKAKEEAAMAAKGATPDLISAGTKKYDPSLIPGPPPVSITPSVTTNSTEEINKILGINIPPKLRRGGVINNNSVVNTKGDINVGGGGGGSLKIKGGVGEGTQIGSFSGDVKIKGGVGKNAKIGNSTPELTGDNNSYKSEVSITRDHINNMNNMNNVYGGFGADSKSSKEDRLVDKAFIDNYNMMLKELMKETSSDKKPVSTSPSSSSPTKPTRATTPKSTTPKTPTRFGNFLRNVGGVIMDKLDNKVTPGLTSRHGAAGFGTPSATSPTGKTYTPSGGYSYSGLPPATTPTATTPSVPVGTGTVAVPKVVPATYKRGSKGVNNNSQVGTQGDMTGGPKSGLGDTKIKGGIGSNAKVGTGPEVTGSNNSQQINTSLTGDSIHNLSNMNNVNLGGTDFSGLKGAMKGLDGGLGRSPRLKRFDSESQSIGPMSLQTMNSENLNLEGKNYADLSDPIRLQNQQAINQAIQAGSMAGGGAGLAAMMAGAGAGAERSMTVEAAEAARLADTQNQNVDIRNQQNSANLANRMEVQRFNTESAQSLASANKGIESQNAAFKAASIDRNNNMSLQQAALDQRNREMMMQAKLGALGLAGKAIDADAIKAQAAMEMKAAQAAAGVGGAGVGSPPDPKNSSTTTTNTGTNVTGIGTGTVPSPNTNPSINNFPPSNTKAGAKTYDEHLNFAKSLTSDEQQILANQLMNGSADSAIYGDPDTQKQLYMMLSQAIW